MRVVLSLFISTLSFSVFAQDMSVIEGNQCRVQAKEIAIKTYQTCVTETKSAKIEQIRKEYQEKLALLKSEYDAQLKNLKGPAAPVKVETKKEEPKQEEVPATVIEPAVIKNETVEQETLTVNQPENMTVILKPAKTAAVPVKKVKKTVAQKRAKGEKGVKGVAKTLPAKQKAVETKPASDIITESELSKTAPIEEGALEKAVVEAEKLETVVDPSLESAQALDTTSSSQQ